MILGTIVNVPSEAAYEIWNFKSIFCSIVGIIWLLICLRPFSKGFWYGTVQNGIYFLLSCVVYWWLPISWMVKDIYAYTTTIDSNGFYSVNINPDRSIAVFDFDCCSYDGPTDYYYEYQVYAMNDSNSENYVCPSWVFHPGCIPMVPALLHLPALGLVTFVKYKVKRYME